MAVTLHTFVRYSNFTLFQTEHNAPVRKVFTIFNNVEVTLKLKKCSFITETIDYLEQITRPGLFRIGLHTTDVERGLNARTDLTNFVLSSVLATF